MKMMPFLRTAYNYDMNAASDESGLDTGTESPVQQQFKEECDINVIVGRFGVGAEMPEAPRIEQYADVSEVKDLRSMLDQVRGAQEAFMEFPADVRARFNNEPWRMVDFVANGANREEAVKLGFVLPPPEVPRDAVKAIDELAAKLVVPKGAA